MTDRDAPAWTTATAFDDFAAVCCHQPQLDLLSDPDSFSLTHRVAGIGPVTLAEFEVGSDLSMDCGELCSGYRVHVPRSGHIESVHRGSSLHAGPGAAAVYQPQGHAASGWAAGTRILALKVDRCAVDDALSDALGRQVTSQIEFTPIMPTTAGLARAWMDMLLLFTDQLFRPDSLLNHPIAGLPFVDSLVRGLLIAADHSHRGALTGNEGLVVPRSIRSAVEIIEEEAHLPLTVSSIAARSNLSIRSLQQGFQRHLGASPMTYLREVRLRRAHRALLESDPSMVTVASIAHRWGFTNLGRFAAAHAARYRETPVEALRRSAFRRSA